LKYVKPKEVNNNRVKYVFGPQVSAKFGISPSSKLLTNLVLYISKCVSLVLLAKFC